MQLPLQLFTPINPRFHGLKYLSADSILRIQAKVQSLALEEQKKPMKYSCMLQPAVLLTDEKAPVSLLDTLLGSSLDSEGRGQWKGGSLPQPKTKGGGDQKTHQP